MCVTLLFQVLAHTNGRAAGLHLGEQPFLIGSTVRVPVATTVLGRPALEAIIRRVLPEGARRTLKTMGWVEYQRPAGLDVAGQQFGIVAVDREDELWVEIHRERVAVADDDDLADMLGPLSAPARPAFRPEDLAIPSEYELFPSSARKRA